MSAFGGSGRPSNDEVRVKTREFVRLVAAGESFSDAQRGSGIAASRALRLFDEPTFWAVARAVRDGELGPTGVLVDTLEMDAAA